MTLANFAQPPANSTLALEPFKVAVPQSALDRLNSLLELSVFPPRTYESTQESGKFGVTSDWMEKATTYWRTEFDWKKHEEHINTFPQFTVAIKDSLDSHEHRVHFAALFSRKPDAIPIMFLHGWPGSFLEFLPTLTLLASRYTPDTLPYHVVVPSLPGYGFSSSPPLHRDFRIEDIARLLDSTMKGLGFTDGYATQGGDIGSKIARVMGIISPSCKAVHLNFCAMPKPKGVDESTSLSEIDKEKLNRFYSFSQTESAYAFEQATKPSTLGFVLSSSPVALLAWVGEKFLDWTDKTPSLDIILEAISLYWFTNCISTASYPYRQVHIYADVKIGIHDDPNFKLSKPLGFSAFAKEILPVPERWIAATGRLVFHRDHPAGGHFAAIEKTAELLADVEDFLKQEWLSAVAGVEGREEKL